jgi:DNA topoisomerase
VCKLATPLNHDGIVLLIVARRFLRMPSERTMQVAESLYQRGILSYPRTETDLFSREFDIQVRVYGDTAVQSIMCYSMKCSVLLRYSIEPSILLKYVYEMSDHTVTCSKQLSTMQCTQSLS